MAGDWLKWSKGLTTRREVVIMASRLGRDRHEIAGRPMVFWEWCDENIQEGDVDPVTLDASLKLGDHPFEFVNDFVGLPGFAEAMAATDVGWLRFLLDGKLVVPKFGRHNGQSAKTRAYDTRKKQIQRQNMADSRSEPADPRYAPASKSPPLSPKHRDNPGTREEKIRVREENKKEERESASSARALSSLDEEGFLPKHFSDDFTKAKLREYVGFCERADPHHRPLDVVALRVRVNRCSHMMADRFRRSLELSMSLMRYDKILDDDQPAPSKYGKKRQEEPPRYATPIDEL